MRQVTKKRSEAFKLHRFLTDIKLENKTPDECKTLFIKKIEYAAPDFLRSIKLTYNDDSVSDVVGDAASHPPGTVLELPRGVEISKVAVKCEADKKVKSLEFLSKTDESLGKIEPVECALEAVKVELGEDEHLIDLHLLEMKTDESFLQIHELIGVRNAA